MRVGHFVSFGIGGADKAAENLVKGLSEIDDVELIIFYNDYSLPRLSKQYDKTCEMVSRFPNYKGYTLVKLDMDQISSLNNFGLDILNTHRGGNEFWHLLGFEKTDFHFKIVESNMMGHILTKADIRVYPSDAMIRDRIPPHVVIPNAVDISCTDDNMRSELGLGGKFVFGRISPPRKEIYSAINLEAYKSIENKDTVFLYVAPCKQALADAQRLKIKNIIFYDQTMDNKVISKLYNTFDVYCHSNKLGETFGMTIAEAMIHGKPVVSHYGSSKWSQAQPEIIGPLSKQLFVTEDIVRKYSEVMKRFMLDREFYNVCATQLKERALNLFRYNVVARKYYDVYKRVMSHG